MANGNLSPAQLRAQLPAQLADKLTEVEAVFQQCVHFAIDAAMRARARAFIDDGLLTLHATIFLSPRSMGNVSVIGEEIMHLHRWTQGYPAVRPGQAAIDEGYANGLSALAGFFDEHAFFPFLEGVGLDPRGEITAAVEISARSLREERAQIEASGLTDPWRVVVSLRYVQAALMASPSDARNEVIALFDEPYLRAHRDFGRGLCAAIDANQNATPVK